MTRGRNAAGCISHSISSQPANSIWISDALLTQTFTRFCQQRRHGSCVPGPLEARRRASRRKTTNLAFPSWGEGFVNPTDFISRGAQPAAWWQNVVNWSTDQTRQSLLSWLIHPPKQPPIAHELKLGEVERKIEPEPKPEPTLALPAEVEEVLPVLEGCRTLDEIRILIQLHSINLQQVPAFCEVILDHLLALPNWPTEIPALLSAPDFHPPGTSLHLQVLIKLQRLHFNNDTWDRVKTSFSQAATLGLISPVDLRAIFSMTANMRLPMPKPTTGRSHKGDFLHRLVTAVAGSPVLHLSDLGKPCLQSLIILLGKYAYFSKALFFLGPWADQNNAHIFIRVVLMRLKDMPKTEHLEDGTTYDLASDLARLETKFLLQTLPQISMHLLGNHPDGPTNLGIGKLTISKIFKFRKIPKFLVNWRLTLSHLSPVMKAVDTTDDIFTKAMDDNPEQYSQLLAIAWTYISMCPDYKASRSLLLRTGFQRIYQQVSDRTSDYITKDRLGRLVVEVYQLAIPNKSFLLLNLAPFIYNRSKLLAYQSTSTAALESLVNRDYSMLTDSKLFAVCRMNYPYELVELAESINPHLPLFKVLSRKWIHTEAKASMVIKRLLKHNHYLKLTLSKFGSGEAPFRVGWLNMKTHQLYEEGMPTPHEALDFINHLAASIATTTMWSPRARFAGIYFLYLYLHKWRGPITKEFTEALWYVCMEYRDEQGPSYTMSRWVLQQIALVEGHSMALRLQVSETARLKRHKLFRDRIKNQDESVTSHAGFDEINRIDDMYWKQSRTDRTDPSLWVNAGDGDETNTSIFDSSAMTTMEEENIINIIRSGKFDQYEEHLWNEL
ncbi:hypothetical protein LTR84_002345 [Exophiala bonariae]|uniref:ATPase expression protein 2, mitochondrial n=1 Tax=Exophiala bonariae TaxID=1690606 RepID=A0AAV9N968_9EURO|nr:hypothetical protein LTR84_002345 [Exophiala bonariae]